MVTTKQDPRGAGWAIRGPVVQLRRLGENASPIELTKRKEWVAGTAAECSMLFADASGLVSRRHASFTTEDGGNWTVKDLESTNGIKQDGVPRQYFQLAPGDVIEMGPIKLIAESEASIKLHRLLQRFLGWSDDRLSSVDAALSSVREMATLRNVLVLHCDRRPDLRRNRFLRNRALLASVVGPLHRLALGQAHPLVFHKQGETGAEALKRAAGGLLCIDATQAPRDLAKMVTALRLPETRVRLVLCAAVADDVQDVIAQLPRKTVVELPSLGERRPDFEKLLIEYGMDGAEKLGVAETAFRPHDPTWLQASDCVRMLDEMEGDALRLVALRNWGVADAARRLGITHGAMSQWARARKLPT
jgi:hypothetical protein